MVKVSLLQRTAGKKKKLKNTTYDRLERTFTNQILSSEIANTLMSNLEGTAIQDAIDDMSEELSFSTIKKSISLSSGNDWLWKKH